MSHFVSLMLLGVALGVSSGPARADETFAFTDAGTLAGWEAAGDVAVDTTRDRAGGAGGSLRIGPGGKAVRMLRDTDGSGTVELWVYEDATKAANPKERRVGPRWGLIQGDGRVLVAGVLYAPYLAGDTTYAASDSDQKNWFQVQYLGLARKEGWHRWTFTMDPEKGLAILYDSKDVNAARPRFDWNRTQLAGFRGIALFGDDGKGQEQTIWVDDVSVQLGGPMKARPVPPPPPPIVPESDPAPEQPVDLTPAVKGKHPRLLFTADDVARLRQQIAGPKKAAFEKLLAYVPACVPPDHVKWQQDATDAQRHGFWRLPTVALHYVLTGERKPLESATGTLRWFVETPDWEVGAERNSGMASANILAGAALAYDWLYNDLEPGFRETVRKKLLLMARWQYYGGHQNGNKATGYWQADPQNNHRWHRDAGLALAALAVAGDGPGWEWILSKTKAELEFIHRWLPEDGSCHESPSYMIFGMPYLVLAFDAADRCLGTKLLEHPYFRENVLFRMHTLTPGLQETFCFGDSGGTGFINDYLFRCTAAHKDADLQAAVERFRDVGDKESFLYGWFSLVWHDPDLKGGSLDKLAKCALFPDLGAAFMRDGWDEADVGVMLKCGPYGGVKLNDYRNETGSYINIAHDDPDCNMFLLYARGKMLAEDDRYAYNKVTRSHNTILVNGKGQRGEGRDHWMQPVKGADMNTFARIVAWKSGERATLAEGEAGNAYTGLERYRRALLWVPGSYVLLLDHVRGKGEVDVTWLMQGPAVEAADAAAGAFVLRSGPVACPFRVASSLPFQAAVVDSTADSRGKPLGFKQLQLSAKGADWRLATLFDAWDRKDLTVAMQPGDDGAAVVVTVTGPNFTDTWTWRPAPDPSSPAAISGKRGNEELLAQQGGGQQQRTRRGSEEVGIQFPMRECMERQKPVRSRHRKS